MNNLEDKILAFSAKLGNEVHLKAIRLFLCCQL